MIECIHCAPLAQQVEASELAMRSMARRLEQQCAKDATNKTDEWVRYQMDYERQVSAKLRAIIADMREAGQ